MNGFLILLTMLLGGVLQAVLPTASWLGNMRPPILLALTLHYALTREDPPMGAAWLAGLVQDALGMLPLGFSSVCFCGAALLVNRFRREIFAGELLTRAVLGALLAGLTTAALSLMLRLAVVDDPFRLSFTSVALKVAASFLLGGIWTPLICGGMARMERAMGFAEVRDA